MLDVYKQIQRFEAAWVQYVFTFRSGFIALHRVRFASLQFRSTGSSHGHPLHRLSERQNQVFRHIQSRDVKVFRGLFQGGRVGSMVPACPECLLRALKQPFSVLPPQSDPASYMQPFIGHITASPNRTMRPTTLLT